MNKNKQLSYEEHVNLAARLKVVRQTLLDIQGELWDLRRHPSRIHTAARKATETVDTLRCMLDGNLCENLQWSDDRWRGVYYGDPPTTVQVKQGTLEVESVQ